MKILICSGFIETELDSFRENQYPRLLSSLGHDVTVVGSRLSWIWKFNRAGSRPSNPTARDHEFQVKYKYKILRVPSLIRVGDFILLMPPVKQMLSCDVVHVIEFRQGNSVLVALIARLMGKPIVYDHEQRGDRNYTILHRIDSKFRRFLIMFGSLFPNVVRHTVLSNRRHYLECAIRKPEHMQLAPLAADSSVFYYDELVRQSLRIELNVAANVRVVLMTGKITPEKRPIQAIRAAFRAGCTVWIVGSLHPHVLDDIKSLDPREKARLTIFPATTAEGLNRFFNAADIVLFTTFTVSYWEAATCGALLVVPRTEFSERAISADHAVLFGDESMFSTVEERYRDDVDIESLIAAAMSHALKRLDSGIPRSGTDRYSWSRVGKGLIDSYNAAIKTKLPCDA